MSKAATPPAFAPMTTTSPTGRGAGVSAATTGRGPHRGFGASPTMYSPLSGSSGSASSTCTAGGMSKGSDVPFPPFPSVPVPASELSRSHHHAPAPPPATRTVPPAARAVSARRRETGRGPSTVVVARWTSVSRVLMPAASGPLRQTRSAPFGGVKAAATCPGAGRRSASFARQGPIRGRSSAGTWLKSGSPWTTSYCTAATWAASKARRPLAAYTRTAPSEKMSAAGPTRRPRICSGAP